MDGQNEETNSRLYAASKSDKSATWLDSVCAGRGESVD